MTDKLDDLLCENAHRAPMGYARALMPRIDILLSGGGVPAKIRRQLKAVRVAANNSDIDECAGLDRLHWFLTECESRYAHKDALSD